MVPVQRVGGGERGREHQHPQPDRVRRHLGRVAGPHEHPQPLDDLGPEGQEPIQLRQVGEVLAADGPEDDRGAGHRAERQADHDRRPQDPEEGSEEHGPHGNRRQELELLEPLRALGRPGQRQRHDHEQPEAEPARLRVEEPVAEVMHGLVPRHRAHRRCGHRAARGDTRSRTRRVRGEPRPGRPGLPRPARRR